MAYRFWKLAEEVRIENGGVYLLNDDYRLGGLSDVDQNLEGKEIVEVEIDEED